MSITMPPTDTARPTVCNGGGGGGGGRPYRLCVLAAVAEEHALVQPATPPLPSRTPVASNSATEDNADIMTDQAVEAGLESSPRRKGRFATAVAAAAANEGYTRVPSSASSTKSSESKPRAKTHKELTNRLHRCMARSTQNIGTVAALASGSMSQSAIRAACHPAMDAASRMDGISRFKPSFGVAGGSRCRHGLPSAASPWSSRGGSRSSSSCGSRSRSSCGGSIGAHEVSPGRCHGSFSDSGSVDSSRRGSGRGSGFAALLPGGASATAAASAFAFVNSEDQLGSWAALEGEAEDFDLKCANADVVIQKPPACTGAEQHFPKRTSLISVESVDDVPGVEQPLEPIQLELQQWPAGTPGSADSTGNLSAKAQRTQVERILEALLTAVQRRRVSSAGAASVKLESEGTQVAKLAAAISTLASALVAELRRAAVTLEQAGAYIQSLLAAAVSSPPRRAWEDPEQQPAILIVALLFVAFTLASVFLVASAFYAKEHAGALAVNPAESRLTARSHQSGQSINESLAPAWTALADAALPAFRQPKSFACVITVALVSILGGSGLAACHPLREAFLCGI